MIAVIDTETNGLPITPGFNKYHHPSLINYYSSSRIIEIAYKIYNNHGVFVKEFSSLIIPDEYDINNTEIHGITYEEAKSKGIYIDEAFSIMCSDFENVETIVAHNIKFDVNIILSECYRNENNILIDYFENKFKHHCTMQMGKDLMEIKKNPKLIELYEYLFDKRITQVHRALSDVEICADCYFEIIGREREAKKPKTI